MGSEKCVIKPIIENRVYAGSSGLNPEKNILSLFYVLRSGDDIAFFDTGFGRDYVGLEQLTELGLGPKDVRSTKIFLTHGHFDHSGAAKFLKDTYGATIYKSGFGLGRDNFFPALQYTEELVYGNTRFDFPFDPFNVDTVVNDGDVFNVGDIKITAFETPWHSPDSICYIVNLGPETCLVSGDSFTHEGEIEPFITEQNVEALAKALTKINKTCRDIGAVKSILGGHVAQYSDAERGVMPSLEQNLAKAYTYFDIHLVKSGVKEMGTIAPPQEQEENSLLLKVMEGCDHNKCTFCGCFEEGFVERDKKEVLEEIARVGEEYKKIGRKSDTTWLQDGNAMSLKTEYLIAVMKEVALELGPQRRIGSYATSRALYRKTFDELQTLTNAGYSLVHVGLESGNDNVLTLVNKGVTADQQLQAGLKAKKAGFELSYNVILGLGGKEHSEAHARDTARILNEINPDFIKFNTIMHPEILMGRKNAGEVELPFKPFEGYVHMTPPETVQELRTLVEYLDVTSELYAANPTNVLIGDYGKYPESKETLLEYIDGYLALPEVDQMFLSFCQRIGKQCTYPELDEFKEEKEHFARSVKEGRMTWDNLDLAAEGFRQMLKKMELMRVASAMASQIQIPGLDDVLRFGNSSH